MMISAPVTVVLSDENNGILCISVWEVNREMNWFLSQDCDEVEGERFIENFTPIHED